ncbi:YpdA family putative bacillithiol disulfide reductase [Allobacillus sp. GCM10007491]|uniref:YpdA family putative bacillithiol disulfide reductase n=1 Tax=Allobacillus saliphilus TaxID=2912308 RepID=A0A941HS41_9BACI|nr:YpdA family putative bacillithiol disulfide reductase [Allobacillus saliphilus]MBR7553271.1 YpdA family putative bacillithiol disulfide reductase [Allobacillus saliphilus]
MKKEKVIIIGAGPCGLSAAIELKNIGIDSLIIEKGSVVDAIYNYPTHQMFFSSSERLEIGQIPFVSERQKPVRNEALNYYRTVATRTGLRINTFEEVQHVQKNTDYFQIQSVDHKGTEKVYQAEFVVMATGYYGQPNYMGIKGEHLPHVSHYFKEAHPFFNKKVVVIGGKNSAVDATLELEKAGAEVTVLYRGSDYSTSVKPWILPLFDSLMRNEKAFIHFNSIPKEITKSHVVYVKNDEEHSVKADYVFAMTGYQPDQPFLKKSGIELDQSACPIYNPNTMETNVENLYVAGVVAAGYNNNKIFIENGRYHGGLIAEDIQHKNRQ